VVHLRKALDNYASGSSDGIEEFAIDDGQQAGLMFYSKQYYRSPFIILHYEQHLGGGRDIAIVFRDRPDRVFRAWVYQIGDTCWLRHFEAWPLAAEDIQRALAPLKPYIDSGDIVF
jgi:hypothetical protein